jgi:hypothetical protein
VEVGGEVSCLELSDNRSAALTLLLVGLPADPSRAAKSFIVA